MRSIIDDGIVFRSTMPEPSVTQRRPSMRISVRSAPRLRSEIWLAPSLPFVCVVIGRRPVPSVLLRACSTSPTLTRPVRAMSAEETSARGASLSSSERAMREPVTTICSSSASCASTTGAWKPALVAPAAISARRTARATLRLAIISSNRGVSGTFNGPMPVSNWRRARRYPHEPPH